MSETLLYVQNESCRCNDEPVKSDTKKHITCDSTSKFQVKVTQSCLTLCDSMDDTVRGIL